MNNQPTHVLDIKLGLDLTELLSPENKPGVKAYLGVKNDSELVEALAQDRYKKVMAALSELDMSIVSAQFVKVGDETQMPAPEQAATDTNISEAPVEDGQDQPQADPENQEEQMSKINDLIVSEIQRAINDFKDTDEEIVNISINSQYVNYVMSNDELYKATDLEDNVEVNFDEQDEGNLMIIAYVDKDKQMQFRVVSDKELEDK